MRVNRGIECESGRLAGATYGRFETRYDVRRFYDDGDGPVWLYQDAGGLLGIIRARTESDAWDIVQDEILDDADEDDVNRCIADQKAEGKTDDDIDLGSWGFGYRPNGQGSNPWNQSGIYSEDQNGSYLGLLTPEDMEKHGIRLLWKTWNEDD